MYILYNLVNPLLCDLINEDIKLLIYYIILYSQQIFYQMIIVNTYNPEVRCNSSYPFHQKNINMREINESYENSIEGKRIHLREFTLYCKKESKLLKNIENELMSSYKNVCQCFSKNKQTVYFIYL